LFEPGFERLPTAEAEAGSKLEGFRKNAARMGRAFTNLSRKG
jgi:hypothetical protein